MSVIFFDPNLYTFTDSEWVGGEALDRLEELLRIISDISLSEDQIERSGGVSVVLPEEIYLSSLEMNPNINNPSNAHYSRIFQSQILPSLMRRRADFEIGNNIDDISSDHVSVANCVVPAPLQSFLEDTPLADARTFIYAYHPQRVSLDLGSGAFLDEVSICDISGKYFVDPTWVFPIEGKHDPTCSIMESVKVYRERLLIDDAAWDDFQPTGLYLHDDFLATLAGADFGALEAEYQNRIVFTFLQVLCARNLTTKEHSMKPQTITYNNKTHSKWNAYVFQMGPNASDTRCSRLYYAKIQGGVLFFRYEEDAHG